jgi:hypothetical protein
MNRQHIVPATHWMPSQISCNQHTAYVDPFADLTLCDPNAENPAVLSDTSMFPLGLVGERPSFNHSIKSTTALLQLNTTKRLTALHDVAMHQPQASRWLD